jgi:hypothetical protein
VHKFEPGEYHITTVICTWENKRVVLSAKADLLGTEYSQSYASFIVRPGKMINVGKLRIHVGAGNRIVLVDVVDLPPITHAALKQEYPQEYTKMETRFMTPSTTAVGMEVDATQRVWRNRF